MKKVHLYLKRSIKQTISLKFACWHFTSRINKQNNKENNIIYLEWLKINELTELDTYLLEYEDIIKRLLQITSISGALSILDILNLIFGFDYKNSILKLNPTIDISIYFEQLLI